ncbi:MAG: hypothetical protein ACP5R5_14865, partial [Armatimonadota bacterium]
ITTDRATKKALCYWDGQKVYDGQPDGLRTDTSGFFCFGATTRESGVYTGSTATVTFDWVRYANAVVLPGDSWPAGLGWYLDGSADPTSYGTSNVMTCWQGNAGQGFFPVQWCFSWHANGNDPTSSLVPNGGRYWISAIACNPADGEAWMSWNGQATYNHDPIGAVWTRRVVGNGVSALGYEGVPEPGAQTVALGFNGGRVYAVTCNMQTGEYNVYWKIAGEPEVVSIAQAKQGYPGTRVRFDTPKLVTLPAADDEFTDYFYVEDDDRTSGIKVIPDAGQPVAKVGQRALVEGRLAVQNGEAVILASSVVTSSAGDDAIKPLGMTGKCVGGLPLGLQPVTLRGGSEDYGWPDNLNTTGLLVRVAGILRVDTSTWPYVYRIDDGSGYPIRIEGYGVWGNDGDKAIVTGVSGVAWDGWNGFRVLLIRSGNDIQVLP